MACHILIASLERCDEKGVRTNQSRCSHFHQGAGDALNAMPHGYLVPNILSPASPRPGTI